MSTHTQQVVQKLWNYCNILLDDGMSYGDYVEQLTYPLFLKMAYERAQLPAALHAWLLEIPENCNWKSLMERDGMQKKGKAGNGRARAAIRVTGEPVKIDVEGMEQVELWESVGG